LAVVATEALLDKTAGRSDRRLSLALSRQQAAGMDRQEQQQEMAVQEAAAGLICLEAQETPRQRHHRKVTTAGVWLADRQPVGVAGVQVQSDRTLKRSRRSRKLVMAEPERRRLFPDRLSLMQAAAAAGDSLAGLVGRAVAVMAHKVTLLGIQEPLIQVVVVVALMTKALQVRPEAMVALEL